MRLGMGSGVARDDAACMRQSQLGYQWRGVARMFVGDDTPSQTLLLYGVQQFGNAVKQYAVLANGMGIIV